MTSALIKITQRREDGQKVVEISLPRRILTALRSMNPSSIRFNFGVNESFDISSDDLKSAIVETYKRKKKKRWSIIERCERQKQARLAVLRNQKKAAEVAEAKAIEKRKKVAEVKAKKKRESRV